MGLIHQYAAWVLLMLVCLVMPLALILWPSKTNEKREGSNPGAQKAPVRAEDAP